MIIKLIKGHMEWETVEKEKTGVMCAGLELEGIFVENVFLWSLYAERLLHQPFPFQLDPFHQYYIRPLCAHFRGGF